MIITAYRPCKQNKLGDGTVTSQQKQLLQQQGIDQPKPCTAWRKDLCPILQKWAQEGEVMLLVDTNSGLEDKDFAPFIVEAGLCDAIGGMHG
eukprot:6573223-Ditylum_brightwellii.AAC.1